MIAVVKCYKHDVKPLVVETFKECDEQTQKVLIDLSCVAVINDSKIETNE